MNDFINTYIFETKEDADKVLSMMRNHATLYAIIRVIDFKEMVDAVAEPLDRNYGWLEGMVYGAKVVPADNGYRIDIRKALPIR